MFIGTKNTGIPRTELIEAWKMPEMENSYVKLWETIKNRFLEQYTAKLILKLMWLKI